MLIRRSVIPVKGRVNSDDSQRVRSSGISILSGKRRSEKSWRNQEENRKNRKK